jgi:hypothetical protein
MTANTTEATRPITINLNESELTTVREIAAGSSDKPVLMMNLNLYKAETGYPHARHTWPIVKPSAPFCPRSAAKFCGNRLRMAKCLVSSPCTKSWRFGIPPIKHSWTCEPLRAPSSTSVCVERVLSWR